MNICYESATFPGFIFVCAIETPPFFARAPVVLYPLRKSCRRRSTLLGSHTATAMPGHTFVVHGEEFAVSEEALGRLGQECMLVQAVEEAGSGDKSVISWAPPLTAASFAHLMQWATTAAIPPDLSSQQIAECFRAADAINLPSLAGQCLAAGPPPSAFEHNYILLEVEASYFLTLGPSTFIKRGQPSDIDRALPVDDMPILFGGRSRNGVSFARTEEFRGVPHVLNAEEFGAAFGAAFGAHGDRVGAPLFQTSGILQAKVEERLPPEARICLNEGLTIAGGFLARAAAELAGISEVDGIRDPHAKCDIDFFITTSDAAEGLRQIRRTLIALARHCEAAQCGMVVVRSPYALTIAMDDCVYDLQLVLCAFDSAEDILSNFDIDACRVSYNGETFVASETFVRALVSGTVIAKPENESANYAKRLHK